MVNLVVFESAVIRSHPQVSFHRFFASAVNRSQHFGHESVFPQSTAVMGSIGRFGRSHPQSSAVMPQS